MDRQVERLTSLSSMY